MAAIHARLLATTSLGSGAPALRARLLAVEGAGGGVPSLRVRLNAVESSGGGVPSLRTRLLAAESVGGGAPPNMRARVLVVEALQEILEPHMATLVFPTLSGLAFDVHRKPIFSTKVAEHTSGEETATSYYQNPKWEYTLTYDYLPDYPRQVGDTDINTMMGFFCQCRGRGTSFLYADPDSNSVAEGFQADFDGVTTDFSLVRSFGGFYEPIGQMNTVPPLSIWLAVTETSTIPNTPGPYTVTVSHAAAYHSTESVTINGVAATLAAGAPAAGQYAVAAGVYTFNSADHSKTAVVRYRYLVDPADYTYTAPNVVAFAVAPPDLATAYATFSYYFVCRFLDDMSDYAKFVDKLWNLSELGFRSIPQ